VKTPQTVAPEGLELRSLVNTIAPDLLKKRLLPLIDRDGRINKMGAGQLDQRDPRLVLPHFVQKFLCEYPKCTKPQQRSVELLFTFAGADVLRVEAGLSNATNGGLL